MASTTYAQNAAGFTATAAARVRVQQGLGDCWQFNALPCGSSAFAMNTIGTKCHPRRLGRST